METSPLISVLTIPCLIGNLMPSLIQGVVVMKKLFLSVLFLFPFAAQAKELATFQEIADTVNQGKQVTFVIDFKECKSEMPIGNVMVSVAPNAVMLVDSNRITASDRHFTLDNPLARGVPLFDFGKYSINADGSASIKTTLMNAKSYERMASFLINCQSWRCRLRLLLWQHVRIRLTITNNNLIEIFIPYERVDI